MIKWFKKFILNTVVNEYGSSNSPKTPSAMYNRLGAAFEGSALCVVYKINNGYVVQSGGGAGTVYAAFTYCADHQALADFFVSNAAKMALGVADKNSVQSYGLFSTASPLHNAVYGGQRII